MKTYRVFALFLAVLISASLACSRPASEMPQNVSDNYLPNKVYRSTQPLRDLLSGNSAEIATGIKVYNAESATYETFREPILGSRWMRETTSGTHVIYVFASGIFEYSLDSDQVVASYAPSDVEAVHGYGDNDEEVWLLPMGDEILVINGEAEAAYIVDCKGGPTVQLEFGTEYANSMPDAVNEAIIELNQ